MLFSLIDLLTRPEAFKCVWREGERYVEPIAVTLGTDPQRTEQTS
jgi:hypothetical protein